MSNPTIKLPETGHLELSVPAFFIHHTSKGGWKLIKPLTKSRTIANRQGEKIISFVPKNITAVEAHTDPQEYPKMEDFSKSDQIKLKKYVERMGRVVKPTENKPRGRPVVLKKNAEYHDVEVSVKKRRGRSSSSSSSDMEGGALRKKKKRKPRKKRTAPAPQNLLREDTLRLSDVFPQAQLRSNPLLKDIGITKGQREVIVRTAGGLSPRDRHYGVLEAVNPKTGAVLIEQGRYGGVDFEDDASFVSQGTPIISPRDLAVHRARTSAVREAEDTIGMIQRAMSPARPEEEAVYQQDEDDLLDEEQSAPIIDLPNAPTSPPASPQAVQTWTRQELASLNSKQIREIQKKYKGHSAKRPDGRLHNANIDTMIAFLEGKEKREQASPAPPTPEPPPPTPTTPIPPVPPALARGRSASSVSSAESRSSRGTSPRGLEVPRPKIKYGKQDIVKVYMGTDKDKATREGRKLIHENAEGYKDYLMGIIRFQQQRNQRRGRAERAEGGGDVEYRLLEPKIKDVSIYFDGDAVAVLKDVGRIKQGSYSFDDFINLENIKELYGLQKIDIQISPTFSQEQLDKLQKAITDAMPLYEEREEEEVAPVPARRDVVQFQAEETSTLPTVSTEASSDIRKYSKKTKNVDKAREALLKVGTDEANQLAIALFDAKEKGDRQRLNDVFSAVFLYGRLLDPRYKAEVEEELRTGTSNLGGVEPAVQIYKDIVADVEEAKEEQEDLQEEKESEVDMKPKVIATFQNAHYENWAITDKGEVLELAKRSKQFIVVKEQGSIKDAFDWLLKDRKKDLFVTNYTYNQSRYTNEEKDFLESYGLSLKVPSEDALKIFYVSWFDNSDAYAKMIRSQAEVDKASPSALGEEAKEEQEEQEDLQEEKEGEVDMKPKVIATFSNAYREKWAITDKGEVLELANRSKRFIVVKEQGSIKDAFDWLLKDRKKGLTYSNYTYNDSRYTNEEKDFLESYGLSLKVPSEDALKIFYVSWFDNSDAYAKMIRSQAEIDKALPSALDEEDKSEEVEQESEEFVGSPLTEASYESTQEESEDPFNEGSGLFNKIKWGTFTAQWKRSGQKGTLEDFAKHVLKHPHLHTGHTRRRAEFYLNVLKGKDPCWKGYEMIGMKMKNGRKVPNCVKGTGLGFGGDAMNINEPHDIESDGASTGSDDEEEIAQIKSKGNYMAFHPALATQQHFRHPNAQANISAMSGGLLKNDLQDAFKKVVPKSLRPAVSDLGIQSAKYIGRRVQPKAEKAYKKVVPKSLRPAVGELGKDALAYARRQTGFGMDGYGLLGMKGGMGNGMEAGALGAKRYLKEQMKSVVPKALQSSVKDLAKTGAREILHSSAVQDNVSKAREMYNDAKEKYEGAVPKEVRQSVSKVAKAMTHPLHPAGRGVKMMKGSPEMKEHMKKLRAMRKKKMKGGMLEAEPPRSRSSVTAPELTGGELPPRSRMP